MSKLHTTPASIAAALRSAADQLDLTGDVELSPVLLQLNLQAVCTRGTADERKNTVDVLSLALVGQPGYTEDCDAPHHRNSFSANRADADVAIYTAVNDHVAGGAR